MISAKDAVDTFNSIFGRHKARALHAKGTFYTGTFQATPQAAALCRARHLQGDPVKVVVRLSNGSGNPRNRDKSPDVRGIGVSFRLADGSSTDLLGQTAPRFPVRTPDDFVELTKAAAGSGQVVRLPLFMLRHPAAAAALVANARAGAVRPPRSYAETTFYTIHAYKWIAPDGAEHWVRQTIVPLDPAPAPAPDKDDRDYLTHEFEKRLADGPARFSLRVQIAADGDDPHDPTSVWKSKRVIDAGTIEVTATDPARETGGELIVFDPTRIIDGIELSDDPILRYRPLAYSESASRRATG